MSDQNSTDGTALPPVPEPHQLTYGSYLRVAELLQLQQLQVADHSHDELLFIIIHQAYELWFKQILFELDTVIRLLENDQLREASRLMNRVSRIEKLLVEQIHLLETMRPRDFCHFRQALTPASGFQSAQFREVEYLSGLRQPEYIKYHRNHPDDHERLQQRLTQTSLRDALYGVMRRRGLQLPDDPDASEDTQLLTARALLPVFTEPESDADLYELCEECISHDQWIVYWRFHHVRVVERVIGYKVGTGGSPGVRYLDKTVSLRLFPALWMARGLLDEQVLFAAYSPP